MALRAFSGLEDNLAAMLEYTLSALRDYIGRASADPALLAFDALRTQYLDALRPSCRRR